MKNCKKYMLATVFVMLSCFLAGCGAKKEETALTPAKGRYVEEELLIPGTEQSGLSCLLKVQGELKLFTYHNGTLFLYISKDGKNWEKSETPEWLQFEENHNIDYIRYGEDGYYYAGVTEYSEKEMRQHFYCSVDGKTAREMKLPILEEVDTEAEGYKIYNTFSNLQVLENGTLAVSKVFGTELILYSQDGEELGTVPIADMEPGSMVSDFYTVQGNTIIGPKRGGKELLFFDGEEGQELRSVEYPFSGSCRLDVLSDGTVLLGDRKGIHRLEPEGTLWQTVVDGELTSLGMPTLYLTQLVALEGEEECYLADLGESFCFYSYDADMPVTPQQELTVYSLRENSVIRQAIALFQRKNSDVKVHYKIGMEKEEGNKSDAIRSLNTRLMDGSEIDIIVLDDLPYASYRDKGVLADLTEIVDTKALLPEVVEAGMENGRLYTLPLRVKLPVVAGRPEAVANSGSLEEIFSYVEENSEKDYIRMGMKQHLLDFFLGLKKSELFLENGGLDERETMEFLESLLDFYEKSGANESEPEEFKGLLNEEARPMVFSNPASMAYGAAEVSLHTMDSFFSFYQIESLSETVKEVSWDLWGDALLTSGYVGMTENTIHRELAEEFIQFLFSEEPQKQELNNGFPVQLAALDALAKKENTSLGSVSSGMRDEEGNMLMLDGSYPEKKTCDKVAERIKKAKNICGQRDVLYNLMFEEIVPLLDGNRSLEETVEALKQKINTYLQETGK